MTARCGLYTRQRHAVVRERALIGTLQMASLRKKKDDSLKPSDRRRTSKRDQGRKNSLLLPVLTGMGIAAVVALACMAWYLNSQNGSKEPTASGAGRKPAQIYGGMRLGQPLVSRHTERQEAVVAAFRHAWKAYRAHAWGKDELKPVSKTSSEWFNLGLTLVDALDTMWLMGTREEFDEARRWVNENMVVAQDKDVNLFETTIRVLGGLLATYHLTNDTLFLRRATELGDRLLPCFHTSSLIPFSDVNLYSGKAHAPEWGPDSSVSEVSTIQIEFRDLAMLTGNKKYQEVVDRTMDKLQEQPKQDNLVPLFINAETGRLRPGTLTMGARADTYYEYLLKQWLQCGKKEAKFKKWFLLAMSGVEKRLVAHSKPSNLTFVGEVKENGEFYPKMDHLVCYLPGLLALGVHNGLPQRYMALATNLMHTCYLMYQKMPTGLSPEIAHFNMKATSKEDIYVNALDRHNLLRPETVESLFYMYRLTKEEKYREWGWNIFQAFEKYTRLKEGGYTSINNVMDPAKVEYRDKMESFFLGETLKYFFLLFSDDDSVINLDYWVINTEAHPLPIWSHYY